MDEGPPKIKQKREGPKETIVEKTLETEYTLISKLREYFNASLNEIDAAKIRAALSVIEERTIEMLRKRYEGEGQSFEKIAKNYGITSEVVRTTMRTALGKLVKKLKGKD